MTDEQIHSHGKEPQKASLRQSLPSKFAMTDADDLAEEIREGEHVHVHGCCSCHSNTGK